MELTDEGCLLRRADSGENHTLLVFFLKEGGLRFVLARRRFKPGAGSSLPDLFETGEVFLQQKESAKPAFLREYTPRMRYPGIARQYKAFTAAAGLAGFYEKNLVHMEHFGGAWDLLQKALQSFSCNPSPEATLFKALFLFARMEGYPVQAHWLEGKSPAIRTSLLELLKKPVGESAVDPSLVQEATIDLNNYFGRETDLLPFS